jgi:hypothetical protein
MRLPMPCVVPGQSSAINSAFYFLDSHQLRISFTDGSAETYESVDLLTAIGLLGARSKGRYFNENIRNHFDSAEF